jgi:hypothetical protein
VPVDQVWTLVMSWYAGRADEQWTPRTPDEMQKIFADAGLTGDFWNVTA